VVDVAAQYQVTCFGKVIGCMNALACWCPNIRLQTSPHTVSLSSIFPTLTTSAERLPYTAPEYIMSTRTGKRAVSRAATPDQPPAKRRAEDQKAPQQQPDNHFEVQTTIKKHYDFDWIHTVSGFVKLKQHHDVTATHFGTGASLPPNASAMTPRNASEDPEGLEGSKLEDSDLEDSDDMEDSDVKDSDDMEEFGEDSDSAPGKDAIGGCYALLMRPSRAIFYDDMEQLSVETSALAFELFDRYGRLKPEFKEQGVKSGSGIWKHELDIGRILLLEDIRIGKSFRRQGWAKKLVAAMLQATRAKCKTFVALTRPGVIYRDYGTLKGSLTDAESDRFCAEELRVTEVFWRSVGFRRIGSSQWFGLASTVNHACHTLPASEDYDLPKLPGLPCYPAAGSLLADIATLKDAEAADKVRQVFRDAPIPTPPPRDSAMDSLFVAIETERDEECVEKLKLALDHLPVDDPRYEARDSDGNTVLHAAAINFKPKAVKWIMEKNALLVGKRNVEQEIPIEALQNRLEFHRTISGSSYLTVIEPASDKFKGFSTEMVDCLCILGGRSNVSEIDFQRLTCGCTCGQCMDGFLSPRMRYAVLCQAEMNYDMMFAENGYMEGSDWVELNDTRLVHVPDPVRENMRTNKSMREGHTNLYNHIATCLKSDKVPNTFNVLEALRNASEWPPVTRNFLERGGNVPSVGSMVFELALIQDELAGDGQHMEVFKDDIEVLPECRNDHEFGFVSGMCGYKRVSNNRRVSTFGSPMSSE